MRLQCSYCGRDQQEVQTLFRGLPNKQSAASAYICDECVRQCYEFLRADRPATRRCRIYADLSIFAEVLDESRSGGKQIFDLVITGCGVALVSPLTLAELSSAPEAVRKAFLALPDKAVEEVTLDDPRVGQLAEAYIDAGALDESRRADALHVAAATVARADGFLTNSESLAEVKPGRIINDVNGLHGFPEIAIRWPLGVGGSAAEKTTLCIETKERVQAAMLEEFEALRERHSSFADFVKVKCEESEWVRQVREKFKRDAGG